MTGLCRHLPLWIALLLSSILAGCGGGSAPNEAPAAVARVVISPSSVLLTAAGASQQLSAQALDADGQPLDVPVTWASSRPDQLSVGAGGMLTAQAALASAQVTATAGGVSSAPMLALAATPAAGVMLVDDANLVGDATDTDPNAEPNADNTYQVTLTGLPAPALGTLMLGRGDKPLAGRVIARAAMGTQTLLTLQLVPLAELFDELRLDEVIDLANAEVVLPPEVLAQFDVVREGHTWRFTPKPGGTSSTRERRTSVTGTHARDILPFRNCDVALLDITGASASPLSLSAPSFSVTISPTLDARYSSATGLERLVVRGEPDVKLGIELVATGKVNGSVKCTLQLFAFHLPISGPLAFFIGGLVPVGVGFDFDAATEFASFKAGAQAEASGDARAGIECLALAGCDFVHDIANAGATLMPKFELPSAAADLRLTSKLHVFGYLEAELGNPLLRSLRFKGFDARIGAELDGKFAPPLTQVLDTAFAANYKASLRGRAQVGTGIDHIIRLLSLGTVKKIGLSFSHALAGSPKAISMLADRASFALGDTVNVSVLLDPATLSFLPSQYNVESLQLRRRVGGLTEVIATQTAAPGQQRFDFTVVAPHAGEVADWHVFVTTRLLPFELLSLELGAVGAGGAPVVVVETSSTMADLAGHRAAACFGQADRTLTQNGRAEIGSMALVGEQGPGLTNCQASVPGVSASITAQIGLDGPAVSATPVSALPVTYSGKAEVMERIQLDITDPAAAWQQRAQANALVEVSGQWAFVAHDAPLAYTVTLSASGNAGVLLSMSVEAPGQDNPAIRLCPRPAPDATFTTNRCFDSGDAPGAVASRTVSGVLQPGQALGIKAIGSAYWEGFLQTSQFGASGQGESGSVQSSGAMTYQVTFSTP